jgi:nitrile hydratase subunit beta
MNGPQDLGGQMGFGPVAPDRNEPLFHAPWEPRALALTVAGGAMGHWTIDESRHVRESLPPAIYYGITYYEIWFRALSALLVRHGFLSEAELASGTVSAPRREPNRVPTADLMRNVLAKGGPTARPVATPARYHVGERVRTIVEHREGHTRLPRYARGKVGVVALIHGGHVFPDTNAHGGGEAPQWLYTVAFDGSELWGRGADPNLNVSIDAWESYLEPA